MYNIEKETDSPPENPANSTLPASNGGRLDLIVVSSNSVWDGVAGEAIRKVFSAAQHGLPQEEPLFNVIHIESSKFNYVLKRRKYGSLDSIKCQYKFLDSFLVLTF